MATHTRRNVSIRTKRCDGLLPRMGWRVPQPRDLLPRRITFERSRHLGGLSQPRWSRVRGLVWRHNWPRSPRIQNLTAVVVMTGGQRASSSLAKEVPRHAIGRCCTERTDGRQKRGLKPLGRDSLTAHYIPNPFNEVATVWLVKLLQSAVRCPPQRRKTPPTRSWTAAACCLHKPE